MDIISKIYNTGIIPVVTIDNDKHAIPIAKALYAGGIDILEITLRTDSAIKSIENITKNVNNIIIGAGTVLTIEQVKNSIKAGAQFVVTPGFNHKVVEYCIENSITILPGCSCPTDIEMAMQFELTTVKFFPAESLGGMNTIRAISAPYKDITFVPTGGINENNLLEYLSSPKILAVGGSWLVKSDYINIGNFEGITATARNTIKKILGFELAHIGINTADEEDAKGVAKMFFEWFGFDLKYGTNSIFASKGFEIVKGSGMGRHGHIAIKTNSIIRAQNYFKKIGAEVDLSTEKIDSGKVIAVYLKDEIKGFAIHLLQK